LFRKDRRDTTLLPLLPVKGLSIKAVSATRRFQQRGEAFRMYSRIVSPFFRSYGPLTIVHKLMAIQLGNLFHDDRAPAAMALPPQTALFQHI
jgi:hypothetical protein